MDWSKTTDDKIDAISSTDQSRPVKNFDDEKPQVSKDASCYSSSQTIATNSLKEVM